MVEEAKKTSMLLLMFIFRLLVSLLILFDSFLVLGALLLMRLKLLRMLLLKVFLVLLG
jgi:hypothetical protein